MNIFEKTLIDTLNENKELNLNTKAMIWAQCKHESMSFRRVEESFSYSPDRLMQISHRVKNSDIAKKLIDAGPEAIANFIYANRMGNGALESGDGWKYRGMGIIMLTGRQNYFSSGRNLRIDLLNNPDKVKEPKTAVDISINYFTSRPWLVKAAKEGDVLATSSWINLGHYVAGQRELPLGIIDRTAFFKDGLKFFERMA